MAWNDTEWRRRLEDGFSVDGVVGGPLARVIEAEARCRAEVEVRYTNFHYMSDSFQFFLGETLDIAESLRLRSQRIPESYASVVLSYCVAFRQFRAAQTVAMNGYPEQGYGLLRDLKDRALVFVGWTAGLSDYETSEGLHVVQGCDSDADSIEDRLQFKRKVAAARTKAQGRIKKALLGEQSGLDLVDQLVLRNWSEVFHQEVHGARLSGVVAGADWIKGKARLSVLPTIDELAMSLFHTNAVMIAWMVHRTLPNLQLESASFGDEWSTQWATLDSCFHEFMSALKGDKPHRTIEAFMRFMQLKLPFNPQDTYYQKQENP